MASRRGKYYLAVTKAEEAARGFTSMAYTPFAKHLRDEGWRVQPSQMRFAWDADLQQDQHIEWWNRGPQLLLVHVETRPNGDASCIAFKPLKLAAALTLTIKEKP